MRWILLSLSVLASACSSEGLNTPTAAAAPTATAAAQGGPSSSAATGLPFSGSFTRTARSRFEPPITLVITGSLTGTASHLGRFTASAEDRVDTTNNTATGTLQLTAANGDQLFTTTVGGESVFVPPNISNVHLTATIVGGTGRFAGATGSFDVVFREEIDFDNASSLGSGTFEGRINLR